MKINGKNNLLLDVSKLAFGTIRVSFGDEVIEYDLDEQDYYNLRIARSSDGADRKILKLASKFLKEAADFAGNRTCNDYQLENTDENWQLIQGMEKWNGDDFTVTRPPLNKPIDCMDFAVMAYLSYLLEEESKK